MTPRTRARGMLAAGAMLAALAGPVSADECSDYRVAFVLREAAWRALMEPDDDPGPEYQEALNRAQQAEEEAIRALRLSIDNAAAAAAIDAIKAARVATVVAQQTSAEWRGPSLPGQAFEKLGEAYLALNEAHHLALLAACRERQR